MPEGISKLGWSEIVSLDQLTPVFEIAIQEKCPTWNTVWSTSHWSHRSSLSHMWHLLTREQIDPNMEMIDEPVIVVVTASFKSKRQRDVDNLLIKPIIDAMKGIVIPDDDSTYIHAIATFIAPVSIDCTTISLYLVRELRQLNAGERGLEGSLADVGVHDVDIP